MRRFYSHYPDGWPGVGLLVLRAAIGLKLMVFAAAGMGASPSLGPGALASILTALVVGVSLLAGLLTRIAGGLYVLIAVVLYLWHPDPAIKGVFSSDGMVMATAVSLLGPGAFSLDARFFGRRKVVIPNAAN